MSFREWTVVRETYSSRTFSVAATQIWNSLSEHIVSASTLQSFRRHLKSFYYNILLPIAL